MKKYTFSIIIPHKNIPKLLQRCLESIPIRDDVEVIIVDDNSDPEIVDFDQFPGKDRPNTTVIFDKSGKGAGRVRNVGLVHATGKWLIFADADDFFVEKVGEILDRYCTEKADVLYFKHKNVLSNNLKKESDRCYIFNKMISDNSIPIGERETFIRCRHNVPWAKIIKRDFVIKHSLYYEEVKYSNDVVFNISLGCKAKEIKLIDEVLYVLTNREGSLTSNNCADIEELFIRTLAHIQHQAIIEKHGYVGLFTPALWFLPRLYTNDSKLFIKALKFSRKQGLSMSVLYKGMIQGRGLKSRIKLTCIYIQSYF